MGGIQQTPPLVEGGINGKKQKQLQSDWSKKNTPSRERLILSKIKMDWVRG